MKDTIRIIHFGDLHLDSPFSSLSVDKSEIRRRELRATFTSIMYYAREVAADIVLISGDLFDDAYATAETTELMCKEFAALPDCRFVIAPGNHDPYVRGSFYASKKLPENVCVFHTEGLSRYVFDDINTEVYGWAFCSPSMKDSPLAGKMVEENGRLHLVCGHCDMASPLSTYCPVTKDDVVRFGAHYNAFSHIHKNPELCSEKGVSWSYSGFVEGRSFDECGKGGIYYIEAKTSGDFALTVKRQNIARRHYEWDKLDVSGSATINDVAERINELIKEKRYTEETLLRVTLYGSVAPSVENLARLESAQRGLFMLEIDDRTSPTFDSEILEKDMTMRGELFRILLPTLTSGTPEERATASAALKIGLAALEGRNIID
ncbi:MAG: metallophosphoesterase [Clostridia bacterium]|nr:metallophosphoesterase [Clostridia bacterium]